MNQIPNSKLLNIVQWISIRKGGQKFKFPMLINRIKHEKHMVNELRL